MATANFWQYAEQQQPQYLPLKGKNSDYVTILLNNDGNFRVTPTLAGGFIFPTTAAALHLEDIKTLYPSSCFIIGKTKVKTVQAALKHINA